MQSIDKQAKLVGASDALPSVACQIHLIMEPINTGVCGTVGARNGPYVCPNGAKCGTYYTFNLEECNIDNAPNCSIVTPDGSVFLTVTAVLLFISTVAALIPALRATSVDPMRTLRDQ